MEQGESDSEALRRELNEEVGLAVRVGPLVGSVLRTSPDGHTFQIFDYRCHWIGGQLRPGDDAADARWVTVAEYRALPLTDGLHAALTNWSVLPT